MRPAILILRPRKTTDGFIKEISYDALARTYGRGPLNTLAARFTMQLRAAFNGRAHVTHAWSEDEHCYIVTIEDL